MLRHVWVVVRKFKTEDDAVVAAYLDEGQARLHADRAKDLLTKAYRQRKPPRGRFRDFRSELDPELRLSSWLGCYQFNYEARRTPLVPGLDDFLERRGE